mmetsp:Transcript_17247/g.49861  ORF Transcript_17247/g.49861 Transcript_17247/m.49861 type:complete len:336 (+) Transcript_17247:391-1398(+)
MAIHSILQVKGQTAHFQQGASTTIRLQEHERQLLVIRRLSVVLQEEADDVIVEALCFRKIHLNWHSNIRRARAQLETDVGVQKVAHVVGSAEIDDGPIESLGILARPPSEQLQEIEAETARVQFFREGSAAPLVGHMAQHHGGQLRFVAGNILVVSRARLATCRMGCVRAVRIARDLRLRQSDPARSELCVQKACRRRLRHIFRPRVAINHPAQQVRLESRCARVGPGPLLQQGLQDFELAPSVTLLFPQHVRAICHRGIGFGGSAGPACCPPACIPCAHAVYMASRAETQLVSHSAKIRMPCRRILFCDCGVARFRPHDGCSDTLAPVHRKRPV